MLPFLFQIFYINENMNLDTILQFIDLDNSKLTKPVKKAINQLLKLFKLTLSDNRLGLLSEMKHFTVQEICSNKTEKDGLDFIFDVIATLFTTESQRKNYNPGVYAKKFYNYFHFIQFRFISDPERFTNFAETVCKYLFKFDSISSKTLQIIFSIFGDNPRIDEAANLLQIDNNQIEVAVGIARLIQGKNIQENIEKFTSQQGFKKMCGKGQMVPKEVQLLLKLSLKAFKLEDLDTFFETFGMK